MEFKSGMLGCAVVMLMLAGAVLGTILISADETTYDVTKYRFETDITGLFPVDSSPEYMEYDLSSNYTGYYTMNTVVNGTRYWGGASFTNTGVNNYPIKTITRINTSFQQNLSFLELPNTDPPGDDHYTIAYYDQGYNPDDTTRGLYMTNAYCVSLTSILAYDFSGQIGSGLAGQLSDYDHVRMTPISNDIRHWVLFGAKSDISLHGNVYWAVYVNNQYYGASETPEEMRPVAITMEYNKATQSVNLYYGNTTDNATYVRNVSLDDAIISFSNLTNLIPGVVDSDNIMTGQIVKIEAWNDITGYMDISKGVTITGVTP